jgi:glutathione S-transferase
MHTLTHFRLCPFSRSIRIALGELGFEVALEEERPWERRPQFLGLNPAGELPILSLADGPMLCGAYAISEYLGALPSHSLDHAPLVALFPGALDEQAEVRRLVDWFHRKFDRDVTRELTHEKIYARLRSGGEALAPDADVLRAIRANLRYHLTYLEFLSHQRKWLAGDEFSFADIAAAAHLSTIDYLGEIAWETIPAAKSWYARIKSRRSLRLVLADRLAGQPPPPHYADLDF